MGSAELAPELIERMVKLVRLVAPNNYMSGSKVENQVIAEARAFVAELPEPVDADLLLLEEELKIAERDGWLSNMACRKAIEVVAKRCIRRVRAEQQPAKATTWQEEH